MKLLIKIIATLAKFALSESTYHRLRSFYYSLKRNRLSAEVEADGFIEWYAKQIDRNVPRMADRISNENIQTGQNDLKLLKKHGLKKTSTLFEHGVGYLRASEHFVRYLNKAKFAGNDISNERIKLGLKRSPDLIEKGAKFYHSIDNNFLFPDNRRYDFIYSSAVICHMPPEDIVHSLSMMKKNLMHQNSLVIFNYSVLDFEHFLFVDELGAAEVLNRVKAGTMEPTGGLLFDLLQDFQGREMLTFAGTNFFHSKKYISDLVKNAGLIAEDVTEPLFDESNSSYYYTRIIKASI